MEQTNTSTASLPMRANRAGASRKLLTRKALQQPAQGKGLSLEASFPTEPTANALVEPRTAPSSFQAGVTALCAPVPAAWSSEDEAALQVLLATRKAAGYQRRGKDISAQSLKHGAIKPNPKTIAAAIVALVPKDGQLSRGELLSRMALASFSHPKARPQDEGWCQGYIAGAIRNGFLAVADERLPCAGEG